MKGSRASTRVDPTLLLSWIVGGLFATLALVWLYRARRRLRSWAPRLFRLQRAVEDQKPRFRDMRMERDIFRDPETSDERERNAWR